MLDYWADLYQLRADGRRVLRWIQRQGVIMHNDPADLEHAKEYLLPVFRAVENEIRPFPLCVIYLYRQSDQPPDLLTTDGVPMQKVDGIAWKDVTRDRGELFAIGLSCEALGRGPEHFRFVFLHELTHIHGCKKHSPVFHRQLDKLIAQFNRNTGGHPVNDYCE